MNNEIPQEKDVGISQIEDINLVIVGQDYKKETVETEKKNEEDNPFEIESILVL